MPRYMITSYPTEFDDIMFSDSGREEVARIVESCLAAGRGAWIPGLIRAGASLDETRRRLEAATQDPAASGAADGSIAPSARPDDLARIGAERFAARAGATRGGRPIRAKAHASVLDAMSRVGLGAGR